MFLHVVKAIKRANMVSLQFQQAAFKSGDYCFSLNVERLLTPESFKGMNTRSRSCDTTTNKTFQDKACQFQVYSFLPSINGLSVDLFPNLSHPEFLHWCFSADLAAS